MITTTNGKGLVFPKVRQIVASGGEYAIVTELAQLGHGCTSEL